MPSRMMTTSSPSSTRRLARSMASSATWVCSSLGRSNVEAMTSPLHRAAHVGDLFGPLVDEQHDELDLGVVALDRRGDRLHDRGLAGLRRRHDEAALALADRRDEVDDPRRHVGRVVGSSRRSFSSGNSAVRSSNRGRRRACSGSPPLTVSISSSAGFFSLRPAGRLVPGDVVALAQAVLAGLLDRDVDVVAARQVALDAQEAVALVAQVEVARRPRRARCGSDSGPRPRRARASSPCGPSGHAPALAAAAAAAVAALAVLLADRDAALHHRDRPDAVGPDPAGRHPAGHRPADPLSGTCWPPWPLPGCACALARVGAAVDRPLTGRPGRGRAAPAGDSSPLIDSRRPRTR